MHLVAVLHVKTNIRWYKSHYLYTLLFVDDRDARLGGDVSIAFFMVGGPFGILAGWYMLSISSPAVHIVPKAQLVISKSSPGFL